MSPLDDTALARLFTEARSHRAWQAKAVAPELLAQLYALVKFGPTAMNAQPLRLTFVMSDAAKAKLVPCLDAGNVEKVKAAPVTAIIAWDTHFYDHLPTVAPHMAAMREVLAKMPSEQVREMALQSTYLAAGYVIIAARSLGLDCGPMSGFRNSAVDEAFFADGKQRSALLINLGYGDASQLFPRAPRLEFAQACAIL